MKTIGKGTLAAIAILLASSIHTFAVVDQALQVQGTNLVLSWPSTGNEYYLIQYRPTLDPSTPWMDLTNCYHANSTNRTTFIVPCCALSALAGTNGMLSLGAGQLSASSALAVTDESESVSPDLWAMPADGSGSAVPLAIYPKGFDTNKLIIFEKVADTIRSSITAARQRIQSTSASAMTLNDAESGGPVALNGFSNGGCDCPDMGFFRVYHIPDWAFNVTNYTYDGPNFFPVNFKDYMDRVKDIQVLLNGEMMPDATFTEYVYGNGQTNWGMGIYFDLLPSGTYQIQLQTTLHLNDELGDEEATIVLSNPIRSITVDNQVTYTNWDGFIFGDSYTFKAQTKNQHTDWYIDIYDYWDNYVNGGYGHTDNGQISWTWDLTDIYGNRRDDLDNDPFLYPYITFDETSAMAQSGGSGPTPQAAQTTRRTPAPMSQYPSIGKWIIAYQDRFYLDAGTNYPTSDSYFQGGLANIKGGLSLWSIPWMSIPLKYGTNIYTQAQRDDSWATLKAYMFSPDFRNIYYYGHGGADSIGGDMHTFDSSNYVTGGTTLAGSKAYLTSQSVSNDLTFNRYAGARPYRFAFLDGCNTANGKWPNAFGVDKASHDLGWYTGTNNIRRVRPSAFIGWTVTIGGKGWGTVDKFWECRSLWMANWTVTYTGVELNTALEDACTTSKWIPLQTFRDKIRVFGYNALKYNEYNHKGDWSP